MGKLRDGLVELIDEDYGVCVSPDSTADQLLRQVRDWRDDAALAERVRNELWLVAAEIEEVAERVERLVAAEGDADYLAKYIQTMAGDRVVAAAKAIQARIGFEDWDDCSELRKATLVIQSWVAVNIVDGLGRDGAAGVGGLASP